jgi:hypothetical protein
MQQLDFDYDASCFDVDPFQAMPGGVGGLWPFLVGRFVELPYTLPQDHTLLVSLGETTPRIWVEKLNLIRRLSGMAMLVTHPDYLDVSSRRKVYDEFCRHVAQQTGAWLALPQQISEWWRQRGQTDVQSPQFQQTTSRARPTTIGSLFANWLDDPIGAASK